MTQEEILLFPATQRKTQHQRPYCATWQWVPAVPVFAFPWVTTKSLSQWGCEYYDHAAVLKSSNYLVELNRKPIWVKMSFLLILLPCSHFTPFFSSLTSYKTPRDLNGTFPLTVLKHLSQTDKKANLRTFNQESVIRGKKRAVTVNSHLQHVSIGNSTHPGRQSWHTTTTSSSLSPF